MLLTIHLFVPVGKEMTRKHLSWCSVCCCWSNGIFVAQSGERKCSQQGDLCSGFISLCLGSSSLCIVFVSKYFFSEVVAGNHLHHFVVQIMGYNHVLQITPLAEGGEKFQSKQMDFVLTCMWFTFLLPSCYLFLFLMALLLVNGLGWGQEHTFMGWTLWFWWLFLLCLYQHEVCVSTC